ncbi:patatin-like phospholipase family protein [Prevotella sp. KH2C16]|uniref:patatin-like phospholipase family protein n=1 Tax=Prevotella sp. KH2C16 TaxID=1855325 RepID=UPI0008E365CB|nr:patatin-like phospholipase family protein [Prevotella sp. KH2C16]SFG16627.1 NTE family protein [Prevotella sp. KH2C16]
MKHFKIACCLLLCLAATGMSAQKASRLKVGLVLGGGGAKGAAEVGVLKYIEQSGIPIDYIAGTSIGSIVGGLYACGYRSAQLDSMFRSQEWLTLLGDRQEGLKGEVLKKVDGVTYIFGFPVGRKNSKLADPSWGAIRGDHIIQLLDSMSGRRDSISFDALPIPFRCVATDYENHREVVLSSGWLARAMRASMAIPGAFKPVDIGGVELLDGGLLNNLPVDIVRAMGADVVIAVDLTQNKHEGEKPRQMPKILENAKGDIAFLAKWALYRPDLVKYERNRSDADVYINPKLDGYGPASFTPAAISEMIEIGRRSGKKALSDLQELKLRVYRGW